MPRILPAVFLALGGLVWIHAQDVLPRPAQCLVRKGTFVLDSATRIVAKGEARTEAERLRDYLRPATGLPLVVVPKGEKNVISFSLDEPSKVLGDEGYILDSDKNSIRIKAFKPAGLFMGIQTLRQLLPPEIYRSSRVNGISWSLPAVHIQDQPRFAWRGSHLDVCRHFLSKEFVLKHLELMAQHKLNVFHWHLTEDQGWRIEIKKYPKLTQIGAWRRETVNPTREEDPAKFTYDGKPHGGFYTQEDIREVVAFAAARHITVVPEIEMPGHARAAVAAYPQLGNFPEIKTEVATSWGVFPQVFSVEDGTIQFLKDVLDEVMELFPGKFIHVGGDECPKEEWAKSPSALARMKQLELVPESTTLGDLQNHKDATGAPAEHPALHKLQSWFIRQMDAQLASKGRRLLGWDEILEGGLAQGATVMSWRGEQGGIDAASQDHDVVMAPREETYLDFTQNPPNVQPSREPIAREDGHMELEWVYRYDPIPAGMPKDKQHHVLGSQAQLWSEQMPDGKQVEYMAWPRLGALAEVFWSPKEGRDFSEFKQRLAADLKRLETQDVNYRRDGGPRWPY